MSAELLPCPFCGGAATTIFDLPACEACAFARRDAASWNRRAPVAAPIDAEGLPPMPAPYIPAYAGEPAMFLDEQMRQAQRDARSLGYALGRGAAVREYVEGREASGAWISVDERKPEARKPILLFVRTLTQGQDDEGRPHEIEGAEVAMGEYRRGMSAEMSYFDCYTSPMSDNDWITHWMPLPDSPTEGQS